MSSHILCSHCGRIVAESKSKIVGRYTWFAECSLCKYGVEGWTKQDVKKEIKKNANIQKR
jgi:hypothetical protein